MKTIKITNIVSSGFEDDFNFISLLQIADKPFSEGGFGKIYHCKKINGKACNSPQVIKIFKDNGQGSAEHSYRTISELQEKIVQRKQEYETLQADFLEQYPAFFGAPQFVFIGELDGVEVKGYSANNLIHFGYICFSDVINNIENQTKYLSLPVESLYAKAYHLARAFDLLNEFAYIHADFKTDNFFVSLNDSRCALIDFDSGAFIHNLTDEPYTWGTPQDMLAPEIYEQISNENSMVKVNLFTDMWSVAVATHYLIFSLHPLFFMEELSRNSMMEYTGNFSWPEIKMESSLFNQEMNEAYEWYCNNVFPDLPKDICECFRYTVTNGYFNPNLRTSYNQWIIKLRPLIPEEEKRYSFTNMKSRKELHDNPSLEIETVYGVTDSDFPQFISTLVEKLIEKETFLYEHREELNEIGNALNKSDLYSKVDDFLRCYYDIISDGIITPIERNKFSFKARSLGVTPAIAERILSKPIK